VAEHDRFDVLPIVSEAVAERIINEMHDFLRLHRGAQWEQIEQDLEQLEQGNPELARAVRHLTEDALEYDPATEKLSHAEWRTLESRILYNHILILRVLNEARREEQG
jgi:DNA-binding transcriptional regulator/RsmH inhibitor MraZ